MVTQVVGSEEPQRLLRRGSCVFSRLYKAFCEGLFEAKLFLTSALHQPTLQLIMDDEWYLDIDPNKVRHHTPLNGLLLTALLAGLGNSVGFKSCPRWLTCHYFCNWLFLSLSYSISYRIRLV